MPYTIVPAQGSDQADEWHRLGFEAQMANNLGLAQQRYQQALRLDPRHALAAHNLAIVFAQSGHLNEGLLAIERASMMDGEHAVIDVNWSLMLMDADRVDDALVVARRGFAKNPNVQTRMVLASILPQAGDAAQALVLYNQILDEEPKHPTAGVNACFVQTLVDDTPADLLRQRKRFWEANRSAGKAEKHRNSRENDRPLRVGYVSGDFKQHSASFIFAGVLLHHTPAVEMYLYSCLPVDPAADLKTKKFQEAAGDRWRDISTVSDEDADRLIRKDKIDILVDLAAHTNGGRLALFMRKPAPVQVTAWGFAHGTGCPEIDYFLADPVAIPPEERKDYAEKIVDLPCLLTMEPPVDYNLKGTSLPPLRKNGYITFGAYARYEKMSDDCLRAMAEIVRRVPDSRIEFKDHAYRRPYSLRRVMKLMEGIEPERLLFSLATSHSDHLLAYQQADLVLDPFPHCGGVVSLEQLYMGVPVVTLYGKQPAGRNTSCVLTAMGHPELLAQDVPGYIELAVQLAEAPKRLADYRKTLRDRLLQSPVVAGYAAAVEKAYKEMFETWASS